MVARLHIVLRSLAVVPMMLTFLARPVDGQGAGNGAGQAASPPSERIVHDPSTGRTYKQQLVQVSVPTTKWKTRQVTQTVYEPSVTTRYVDTKQPVYVPRQAYVLEARTRGLWNPFRQPVVSYEYRPVTEWVAVLQDQKVPLTSQNWVAKEKTFYVSEPVRETEVQQQIVTTEIPSAGGVTPNVMYANQPSPRIRIPLLARQQVLPNALLPAGPVPAVATAPRSSSLAQSLPAAQPWSEGLRPISNATASLRTRNYSAPLRTASNPLGGARDSYQAGMAATVLR